MESVAAWGAPSLHPGAGRRAGALGVHALASVASLFVHTLLLIEAAHLVVQTPNVPSPIAVTLLQVAPPPPPPGADFGVASLASAPAIPVPVAPVTQPPDTQRMNPQPVTKRTRPVLKRERGKPAKPMPQLSAPIAEPSTVVVPAGSAAGVAGGIAGGVPDGQLGGTVGGQGDVVLRPDQIATAPALIKKTLPEYPPAARAQGVEGAVVVGAIISREGVIEADSVHIIESMPIFDTAAVEAVHAWRFRPGRDRDGHAVRVRVQIPLRFRLR
jgi:protein TonB